MAVGDVVNGIFTTINVYHYFIPAAGVEVCITFMGGKGTAMQGGLYDGVTIGQTLLSDSADFSEGMNTKLFITNTNYLNLYSNGDPPFYSGIQIK